MAETSVKRHCEWDSLCAPAQEQLRTTAEALALSEEREQILHREMRDQEAIKEARQAWQMKQLDVRSWAPSFSGCGLALFPGLALFCGLCCAWSGKSR